MSSNRECVMRLWWYELDEEKSYEQRLLEAKIELAYLQWKFGIINSVENEE